MINDLFFKSKLNIDKKIKNTFFEKISKETQQIGFYNLAEQNVSEYIEYSKTISKKNIVVLGIGGSSLGAFAVFEFLKFRKHLEKNLIFLDTTDPITIEKRLNSIDLKDSLFLIISKSGSTIETVSAFKVISHKLAISPENYAIITDKNSQLDKLALEYDLKCFYIPKNVGGRYSVLSAVGLVPLALAGVDIEKLIQGAKNIKDSFFQKGDLFDKLIEKAYFYGSNRENLPINTLFGYSDLFRRFNDWYVQLWAESLGKVTKTDSKNTGLTPIGLIGPNDQHSFLQLIMEGNRNKTVTFIKIKDFESDLKIPAQTIKFLEEKNFINNLKFADLINLQADSTIEALNSIGINIDVIEIEKIDEVAIGELIYYFQLLTAITAQVLDIDAYDQEGVELGKKILKAKLQELNN